MKCFEKRAKRAKKERGNRRQRSLHPCTNMNLTSTSVPYSNQTTGTTRQLPSCWPTEIHTTWHHAVLGPHPYLIQSLGCLLEDAPFWNQTTPFKPMKGAKNNDTSRAAKRDKQCVTTWCLYWPREQLLKAHYRSKRHRAGVGYNHFRPGFPSGYEWLHWYGNDSHGIHACSARTGSFATIVRLREMETE